MDPEPGLANGGLGRLAACFLDSLATLGIPAIGYGIRYEYGIFRQEFVNGWQAEQPDEWLTYGYPWDFRRPDDIVDVGFNGSTEVYRDEQGRERVRWLPGTTVRAEPYHILVPGYDTPHVNLLRLWRARAREALTSSSLTQATTRAPFMSRWIPRPSRRSCTQTTATRAARSCACNSSTSS